MVQQPCFDQEMCTWIGVVYARIEGKQSDVDRMEMRRYWIIHICVNDGKESYITNITVCNRLDDEQTTAVHIDIKSEGDNGNITCIIGPIADNSDDYANKFSHWMR